MGGVQTGTIWEQCVRVFVQRIKVSLSVSRRLDSMPIVQRRLVLGQVGIVCLLLVASVGQVCWLHLEHLRLGVRFVQRMHTRPRRPRRHGSFQLFVC